MMNDIQILIGDVRKTLKDVPDNSVNCCVTSPPYYGLRSYVPDDADYKDSEIGMEQTPEEFIENLVEVFREVKRVLTNDGVCYINIGDSYYNYRPGKGQALVQQTMHNDKRDMPDNCARRGNKLEGLKEKDLIGIPWALAAALRAPYYTGHIKKEIDRVWLAAMMDGEGSISGFIHDRPDGTGIRTGVNVCLTNTCLKMLDNASKIWPASLIPHQIHNERLGKRPVFRWKPSGAANTGAFLAEIYPYLITKKTQALLAWNLLEFQKNGQKWGKSNKAEEVREKRNIIVGLLSELNKGKNVIVPSWCVEPPSLFEKGWYLRQDIIWAKACSGVYGGGSVLPESCRDRFCRSHEYLFLLTKSQKYYFNQEAVAEKQAAVSLKRAFSNNNMDARKGKGDEQYAISGKSQDKCYAKARAKIESGEEMTRNRRSVWTVGLRPSEVGHFAPYPAELVEPCILSGCPDNGIVLDPFGGTGTTAVMATLLGRKAIHCDLDPRTSDFIKERKREIIKQRNSDGETVTNGKIVKARKLF